jgi:hypothetical protein
MDLRQIGYEHVKWNELAQDYIQQWVLVLAMLNLGVLHFEIKSVTAPT